MRTQRTVAQMKEQNKTPEKEQNEVEISTGQNTGFQDAPGTHWVLQQHKNDPGRNEGCIK